MSQFNRMCVIGVMFLLILGGGQLLNGQCTTVKNEDTGECFATIQAAIDDADTDAGDTITVPNGTYNEQVTIDKEITLQGQSNISTRIENNTAPGIVLITADNVTIKNIGILWQGVSSSYYYAVKIEGDNCTLDTVLVAEAKRNIYIYGSSGNTIRNSFISTTTQSHECITILSGSNNTVCGNTIISGGGSGGFGVIILGSSTGNEIIGNDIQNFDYGIYIYFSSGNTIYYNNFKNNTTHAYVSSSSPYNTWDDGGTYGGNYWEGFSCTCYNCDCYCSSSKTIATGEVDNYPLCRPKSKGCQ